MPLLSNRYKTQNGEGMLSYPGFLHHSALLQLFCSYKILVIEVLRKLQEALKLVNWDHKKCSDVLGIPRAIRIASRSVLAPITATDQTLIRSVFIAIDQIVISASPSACITVIPSDSKKSIFI
ncbi:hypothetical protein AVEN_180120-1 [Araneus ventricosus]|uniref:Uncharacterized protein n=1 Tax=Araneus ventricosus TaxID=182803 RepID=A0A4Y2SII1_ARAVE|nr:hypothetical protein AVEN_205418-1 [Araneus ventricosus]GBN87116.1 hypothetical protein AVEN_180120-1 [Araneus ventricosus]